MNSDFLEISLGSSFMLNAGICGFIKFLEHNNADENNDYKISGQTLYISKEYLKNNENMGMKYVNTMAEIFDESSGHKKFLSRIHNKVKILENVNIADLDENLLKECIKDLNEYADKMLMASKISVYNFLNEYDDIIPITREPFDKIKKSNDLSEKYEIYKETLKLIQQPTIRKLLVYTELLYGKFKLFFNENSQQKKITYLCEKDKRYDITYNKSFYELLLAEIEEDEKKKNSRCIECMGNMKHKKDFTFLIDTADDLNRKKSYYWNCTPDAFVCPLCAFVYTFIPLGFLFFGGDALFVNANSSIRYLKGINQKTADEDSFANRRLLRIFTDEKINAMENVESNVQVILHSNNYSHFRFDIIDVQTIKHLRNGKKYLNNLEKINKKFNFGTPNDLHIYDIVFDHIYMHQSFYGIIDRIMKHEFDNNFDYLKNILYLENIFYGGEKMEELNKKVRNAHVVGKELRKSILGENAHNSGKEDDNKLRGVVYRLLNLTAVGDRSQFIDTVLRIYTGYNLTIPSIFKDCYQSDEMFKAISHGFILGLKYVPYNEKENKNDE